MPQVTPKYIYVRHMCALKIAGPDKLVILGPWTAVSSLLTVVCMREGYIIHRVSPFVPLVMASDMVTKHCIWKDNCEFFKIYELKNKNTCLFHTIWGNVITHFSLDYEQKAHAIHIITEISTVHFAIIISLQFIPTS